MKTLLQVNASGRIQGSVTRDISDKLVAVLANEDNIKLHKRELTEGLPFVDENWIGANFTAPEDRSESQKQALALSDALVEELKQADVLVIGSPIYNFQVPAVLKAWIDMIARARLTFKYTENGPVGLLANKKAYVVVASGGVKIGSNYDFVSPYLKHVLGFIGISDVTVIDATQPGDLAALVASEQQVITA